MTVPGVDELAALIEASVYRYATEDALQEGLYDAIAAAGWPVVREHQLDRYSRLDLLVGDPLDGTGVAVEVKVAGGRADALRQIRRYVGYPQVGGLVLVTSRVRHGQIPPKVMGKPVRAVVLALQAL